MNYELAKQLKDAGFPQKGSGICQKHEQVYSMHLISDPDYHYCDDFAYIPTLEELIEACLEGGKCIQLNMDAKGCGAWMGNNHFKEHYEEGSTPTEAVAKLWLSLKNNE